jgi:hypothetical protein
MILRFVGFSVEVGGSLSSSRCGAVLVVVFVLFWRNEWGTNTLDLETSRRELKLWIPVDVGTASKAEDLVLLNSRRNTLVDSRLLFSIIVMFPLIVQAKKLFTIHNATHWGGSTVTKQALQTRRCGGPCLSRITYPIIRTSFLENTIQSAVLMG